MSDVERWWDTCLLHLRHGATLGQSQAPCATRHGHMLPVSNASRVGGWCRWCVLLPSQISADQQLTLLWYIMDNSGAPDLWRHSALLWVEKLCSSTEVLCLPLWPAALCLFWDKFMSEIEKNYCSGGKRKWFIPWMPALCTWVTVRFLCSCCHPDSSFGFIGLQPSSWAWFPV